MTGLEYRLEEDGGYPDYQSIISADQTKPNADYQSIISDQTKPGSIGPAQNLLW